MKTKKGHKRESFGTLYFEDGNTVDKFAGAILEDVRQANEDGKYTNITIETEYGYDNNKDYVLFGDRPLTDKERAALVVTRQKEKDYKTKLKLKNRDAELATLKRLQAKYPDAS